MHFLSQFWADINGNECIILKKELRSTSLCKKLNKILKKSHFESICSTLRSAGKDGASTNSPDRTLIRLVDDQIVCSAALPHSGGYFVDVYVTSSWEPDTMDLACVFRVRCTATTPSWMSASFPPGICFGRTPLFAQLSLIEQTHTDPYVEHQGELVVAFSMAGDVRLSHTLQRFV